MLCPGSIKLLRKAYNRELQPSRGTEKVWGQINDNAEKIWGQNNDNAEKIWGQNNDNAEKIW